MKTTSQRLKNLLKGPQLNLSEIKQLVYPQHKYFRTAHKKTQIVLHHTVSGKGVGGDIAHWLKAKFNMGTCVIISRDGLINQVFSSKWWAYHLGVKESTYRRVGVPYKRRDQTSIGVELDSYGGLKKDSSGLWRTVYGSLIDQNNVIEYPNGYRGFYAFERYTPEQIEATRQLIVFWSKKYGIPLDYQPDMWETNANALSGKAGVWSHTSFRFDKSDVHPQPELIEMLKNLTA